MKFCPYCGAGLDADMRFCPKCGKPFEDGKDNPHITAKHLKPESPTYDSVPVSAPTKKKKRGGIIALVIVAVLIAVGAGLYFSGVFAPKEEPKLPFSDDTAAIAQASQSVVMLTCYNIDGEEYGTGSGFAAFDDGIIVTNYHVIEEEVYSIRAQTEGGISFECPTVLAYDAKKDIAILKADRETGLHLLPLGDSIDLQKGAKVVAIGSPLGLINSVSTGVFSGYVDDDIGKALQFTAAISHGSSGGALFNNAGEVIGITYASLSDGQNLNMAVPIEEAKALYESASIQKQMSMVTFYETFDHTPPIPIYTVDDMLAHSEELDKQEIYVEGYISAIEEEKNPSYSYYRLYLVETPDKVINEFITNNYTEVGRNVLNQVNKNEILVVFPADEQYEDLLRQFSTGDHVIFYGKVEWVDFSEFPAFSDIRRTVFRITEAKYYSE